MIDWIGMNPEVDWPALARLLVRLTFNLLVTTLVIRLIYYRLYRNREYVFTYYLFSVITFLLCNLLQRSPIQSGVALALFGVFGILRYRTEQIRMRDLTYLFIVIGIGVLNGIADRSVSFVELCAINGAIVAVTASLELGRSQRPEITTAMLYDRLEMLGAGKDAGLLEDIRARTGMNVLRVEVHQVDLLRDAAEISVIHRPRSPQSRS